MAPLTKNKKILIILAALLLLIVAFLIFKSINAKTDPDRSQIEEKIQEAIIVNWAVGAYPAEAVTDAEGNIIVAKNTSGKPSDFTAAEKATLKSAYEDKLKNVYLEDSTEYNYMKETNERIIDSNTALISNVIEIGIFEYTVESLDIEQEKATIKISATAWEKYVSQREDTLDFYVNFPINTDKLTFELQKQGGEWRVVHYTVSQKSMDADTKLDKTFKTYEEAVAYANATTPRNTFINWLRSRIAQLYSLFVL